MFKIKKVLFVTKYKQAVKRCRDLNILDCLSKGKKSPNIGHIQHIRHVCEICSPHLTHLLERWAAAHAALRDFMVHDLPPPNPTLDAERQAGRHWVPFLRVFGMTRPGIEPPTSQAQGGRSNHKATELVKVA